MPLTQDLGRFVAAHSFERMPQEAVEIARTGFIDTIATMIAGAQDDAPQLLKKALAPARGEATLYFTGEPSTAPEAAWINGTAGHALDYDDVGCRGHLSTVLVPAVLAEAETLNLSGAEMLAAYVAGYETWAELARRDPGHHHRKGWHPTGIFGAIGAGAACAALRRLDQPRATSAVALSASQARRHHGQFRHHDEAVPRRPRGACRRGLRAARRARLHRLARRAGASARLPVGGIARGQGRPRRPNAAARRGVAHPQEGLSIKKYPACYCTHRSLDAMLDLLAGSRSSAADIKSITVAISDDACADPAQPRPADRARSQVQHAVRDGGGGRSRGAPASPNTPTHSFAAPRCRS